MNQRRSPYRVRQASPNKYKARKTTVCGIEFDSQAEADRYLVLLSSQQAGEISGLVLQPKYELQPSFKRNGKTERAITYTADFEYIEAGQIITEEVKGFETKDWRLRRRLFLYQYPDHVLRVIRNGKEHDE